MSEKLFQVFAGVIPANTPLWGGTHTLASDTPFLAMGLWKEEGNQQPWMLCMVQGGRILSARIGDVRVDLSDEMKRALAQVVLTS